MTEIVRRVGINELTLARVTCRKCGTTVEIELSKISRAIDGENCTSCKEPIIDDDQRGVLKELSNVMASVKRLKDVGVEFSISE